MPQISAPTRRIILNSTSVLTICLSTFGVNVLPQSSASDKHDQLQILREQAGALAKQGRFTEARPLLERSCDGGDMESCYELAIYFMVGFGTEKNSGRALQLYQKACDGTIALACAKLSTMYLYGDEGVTKNPNQSAIWAVKACDYGAGKHTSFTQLPRYCANLNSLYRGGYVAEQDIPKAHAALDRACKLGLPGACRAEPGHQAANPGANASAQSGSSTEIYPTLTADQMRDMAVGSKDIAFMARLIRMRQLGVSTDLKFFIQLNNCNNTQFNRLLDNEFEYPKIAAYYQERAPEILSKIPTMISYWRTYSLIGKYDPSTESFRVDPEPGIMSVHGTGYPRCPSLGVALGRPSSEGEQYRSPGDDVDRYVVVPFHLTRLPMAEEVARQYVGSLANPAQRRIALKFSMQVSPDTMHCKSAAEIRGEILNAPRAPSDVVLNPDFWADIRGQLQDARDQCVYSGPLVGSIAVAEREDGATLATFDPDPSAPK